jgi:predicted DNA-binding protein (MmcQ/YjbR family)
MRSREEVIHYCKTFENVYEDYPFHDDNWTIMRCKDNKKIFACIFQREEDIWVNVKASTEWIDFWRNAWPSVIPAYHMNKSHWNSLVLNGVIPEGDIKRMIAESYDLVKPKKKVKKNS